MLRIYQEGWGFNYLVKIANIQTRCVKEGLNDKYLLQEKSQLDNIRVHSVQHILKCRADIKKHNYEHFKRRVFKPGYWDLNQVVGVQVQFKLDTNWKAHIYSGEEWRKMSLLFKNYGWRAVTHPWNIVHLKLFYRLIESSYLVPLLFRHI